MTEKQRYTYDEVLAWAEAAVAEMGEEFVYDIPSGRSVCAYVHPVKGGGYCPGCLIGNMLLRNTVVTEEELALLQNLPSSGIRTIVKDLPVRFTQKAMDFMATAQGKQDTGATWGWALKVAKEMVEVSREGYDYDRDENRMSTMIRRYGMDASYEPSYPADPETW